MGIKKTESTTENKITFTTIEKCGVISQKGNFSIELRYGSWGNNPPKYDLRTWEKAKDGEKSKRGLTLSGEELIALGNLISKMNADE